MGRNYSEMTLEELKALQTEKQEQAARRYKELMREYKTKNELLGRINQLCRIHSCTTSDPKSELAHFIVDMEIWSGWKRFEDRIKKLEAEQA